MDKLNGSVTPSPIIYIIFYTTVVSKTLLYYETEGVFNTEKICINLKEKFQYFTTKVSTLSLFPAKNNKDYKQAQRDQHYLFATVQHEKLKLCQPHTLGTCNLMLPNFNFNPSAIKSCSSSSFRNRGVGHWKSR